MIDLTTFHKLLLTSKYIADFFIFYSTLLMPCRIFIYWSETWYIGSFFFMHPVEWEKERERERKKERKKEKKNKDHGSSFPVPMLGNWSTEQQIAWERGWEFKR